MSIQYCPYTNSSPPLCQTLSPLLLVRDKKGGEFRKALTRAFNEMPPEGQQVVRAFDQFLVDFTQTILKVAKIIPAEYINLPLTVLNYPDICLCAMELSLSTHKYQKLQELGYDVDWGCICACGYGDLTVKRRGKRITWKVVECMCHPGQYFLVLKPIGKKR